jgi:quinol monooxygenase YgiN
VILKKHEVIEMAYLFVKHKVKEFDSWKKVYDEHKEFRKESGELNNHVFRNTNDPNEIMMQFEWDSISNARKFTESEGLKEAMKDAGVMSKPEMFFV